MTVVFDKLSFMRHLGSEGTFARPQAEKLSEAFHQAVQETVATRADIDRLEARIDSMDAKVDAKLARLEGKIDTALGRFEAASANTKVWAVGVGVALFSALSAIRFFGH